MTNVFDAICIDLDGTLTDPKRGITRCIQYAFERLGRAAPEEDALTWCIGPPLLDSLRKLLGSDSDAQAALLHYRERFGSIGLFENELYPGIPEVLTQLADSGCRLFVATSKPTVYAGQIIDHFGLRPYFQAVCGSELDGTRTDKTVLLAWLLAERGLDPHRTAMIGDRRHDIIGARNNGLKGFGVLYGYGSRAELVEAGASGLCARPEDMADVIREAMR